MKKLATIFGLIVIIALLATVAIEWDQIWYFIKGRQRFLNRLLMGGIRSLNESYSLPLFLKLIGVSLVYGIFHALGPGHGKVVITGYLIDNKKSWKTAVRTSFFGSITHVGVAIILAFVFHYLFTGLGLFAKQNINRYLSLACGVVIMGFGVIFLVTPFAKSKFNLRLGEHIKRDSIIGILAGIVPCPVTMSVVLVSLSYSILYVGVAAAIGVAIGLFITLCLISIFPLLFARGEEVLSRNSKLMSHVKPFVPVAQGIFFIVAGILLLPV